MPDHVKTLREAARVLRPGGLLAASVFGEEQQTAEVRDWSRHMHLTQAAAARIQAVRHAIGVLP